MIFNVIVTKKIYYIDSIYIEIQPEPLNYRDLFITGYTIYDLQNSDSLIEEKKDEVRINYYNELKLYDANFSINYQL